MSTTATIAPEVTAYQAAWDEKLKKHNRFARSVNYGMLTIILGVVAWFGIEIFKKFSILASSADAAAKHDATISGGALTGGFMLVIILLGMVSLPFMRAVGWSEWALGERPTDDYKPREAKPIGVTIEHVNEDLRYFHVSGLYRPEEDYAFKVERLTDKRLFRRPEYSFSISEKDDKVWLRYTIDSSCFRGMTEAEITKYLMKTISFQLEEKTDHFKELNYAI
jgi:hypothetical protein